MVGISRSLKQRCRDHPNDRSGNLETLNLPPLSLQEALTVEEALIANFGPGGEQATDDLRARGQLTNKIHAIRPRPNADYCRRLLGGQSLLVVTGYGPYARGRMALARRGSRSFHDPSRDVGGVS